MSDIRSRRWDTAVLTAEDREYLDHLQRFEARCSSARNLRPGMTYRVKPIYLRYHPVAECYPVLEGEDMDALVESIQTEGQDVPILTYCGYIVDGRNRHLAVSQLGIEAKCQEIVARDAGWSEKALEKFAEALNVKRRHLTDGQRAARAWEKIKDSEPSTLRTRAKNELSAAAGVSPRLVDTVMAVDKADPEAFEEVKAGNLSPQAGLVAAQASPEARSAILSAARSEPLTSTDARAIVRAHDVERDSTGRALPRELIGSYGAIKSAFEDIASTVEGARRTWDAAVQNARRTTGETVTAEQVLASMPRDARAFLASLSSAARVLRQAAPYSVCPWCRAASLVDGKACRGCRGGGFVGQEVFKSAPEELRRFTVPVQNLSEHR